MAPPRDGGDGVDVEIERLERMKVHVESEVEGGAKIEDEKEAWVSHTLRSCWLMGQICEAWVEPPAWIQAVAQSTRW